MTRARVTPDRQGLVLLQHAASYTERGVLVWVSWEGEREQELYMEGLHTDFTTLPDGRVAVLGREVRDLTAGRPFLGETIVEVDPEGGEEVVWSVLDGLPPLLDQMYAPCPEAFGAECYSHINSIAYVAAEDAYLLTAAALQMVLLVDRASGEVLWTLGGPGCTYTVSGLDSPLGYPHSAQLVPGGVLVFDDQSPYYDGASGAVEFALDTGRGTATPRWGYAPKDLIVNHFLGNAQRLWDGRSLVAVPDVGALDIVDADGNLERRIRGEHKVPLRFAEAIQSLHE